MKVCLQVQYQNLVNELIKNIIIFSEDIFPSDGGHVYEKYISRDSIDLEVEVGDAPSEAPDDVDSEPGQSEDGECLARISSYYLWFKALLLKSLCEVIFPFFVFVQCTVGWVYYDLTVLLICLLLLLISNVYLYFKTSYYFDGVYSPALSVTLYLRANNTVKLPY